MVKDASLNYDIKIQTHGNVCIQVRDQMEVHGNMNNKSNRNKMRDENKNSDSDQHNNDNNNKN
eukprot:6395830-Amphidinium_carterae.2